MTSALAVFLFACCAPVCLGAGGFLESSADFVLDAKVQSEQMNRLGTSVRSLSPRLDAGGAVARRQYMMQSGIRLSKPVPASMGILQESVGQIDPFGDRVRWQLFAPCAGQVQRRSGGGRVCRPNAKTVSSAGPVAHILLLLDMVLCR